MGSVTRGAGLSGIPAVSFGERRWKLEGPAHWGVRAPLQRLSRAPSAERASSCLGRQLGRSFLVEMKSSGRFRSCGAGAGKGRADTNCP